MGGIAGSLSCLARRLVTGSVTIRPASLRSCTRGLLCYFGLSHAREEVADVFTFALNIGCFSVFGTESK